MSSGGKMVCPRILCHQQMAHLIFISTKSFTKKTYPPPQVFEKHYISALTISTIRVKGETKNILVFAGHFCC